MQLDPQRPGVQSVMEQVLLLYQCTYVRLIVKICNLNLILHVRRSVCTLYSNPYLPGRFLPSCPVCIRLSNGQSLHRTAPGSYMLCGKRCHIIHPGNLKIPSNNWNSYGDSPLLVVCVVVLSYRSGHSLGSKPGDREKPKQLIEKNFLDQYQSTRILQPSAVSQKIHRAGNWRSLELICNNMRTFNCNRYSISVIDGFRYLITKSYKQRQISELININITLENIVYLHAGTFWAHLINSSRPRDAYNNKSPKSWNIVYVHQMAIFPPAIYIVSLNSAMSMLVAVAK